jgi:hypothetical protein
MTKIKNFDNFINEVYQPTQGDAPEVASQMNNFNSKEAMIKDFETHKVDVNNIYMTYKDEADLINKLAARKLIVKKTSNKKEIKFTNELLAIWAQSCEKRRDLKEIDDNIKKLEEDNINRQENIKNNPSLKDSENESIKMNSDKITSKKTEIANLQKEILNLEKEAKDKLNKIKIDLSQSKKKIDLYRTEKTAAAAKTSE